MCSPGVSLSVFDACGRLFDRDMTASHSRVYVCLLTAPDCCETHRENSLFPFQSEAQATSITSDRGGREGETEGRSGE